MNSQDLYTTAIRALEGRAEVYHIIGALQKSRLDFERVIKLSLDVDHKRDALIGLSILFGELGDYDKELSYANKLIRFTRKMDLVSKGKALNVKADALRDKGKFELSLKTSQSSINLFRSTLKKAKYRRGDRRMILENISNAYTTMGSVNSLQGRYGSALDNFRKRLGVVKKNNDQIAITQSLNNIGLVYRHNSKYEVAENYFKKSLAIAQKIGYKNAVAVILGNIGMIHNDLDEYDVALGYYLKAVKISEEVGNKTNTASHLLNAGLSYENLCDINNAFKYYTLSLNIFKKIGNKFGIAMALCDLGMNYCDRGDYERALTYINQAGKIASYADLLEIVIRCASLKAQIYRSCKKYAKSIRLSKNGIKLAAKYKMEELKIMVIKEFVSAAIEEKSGKYLAGISDYMTLLGNLYKSAHIDKTKGTILVILIKYDMARKKYKAAEIKFRILSGIANRLTDRELTALTILLRARLNIAAGRDYADQIKKARELVKETGWNQLLGEIKEITMEKGIKNRTKR